MNNETRWWCPGCDIQVKEDEISTNFEGIPSHDICKHTVTSVPEFNRTKLEKAIDNMPPALPEENKEEKISDLVMFAFGRASGDPRESFGIAKDLIADLKKLFDK